MISYALPVSTVSRRAVVLGGSIAGLLAAQVLADHFEQVIILERDALPLAPVARPGVTHARHPHGFTTFLHTVEKTLWPGLSAELIQDGAVAVADGKDTCWLIPTGRPTPQPPARSWLSCSRALAEWRIRQRVAALPNLHFVEETAVIGLVVASDSSGVSGVQFRQRHTAAHTAPALLLPADLVVDASGRHSKAPQWLAALGSALPAETVLINQPYAVSSCIGVMPTRFDESWKWLSLYPDNPADGWSIGVFQIEGRRWLVTMTMSEGDRPPTDRAEFVACLQSAEHPHLSPLLAQVQWLSNATGGGHTTNRWRHYEALPDQPGNFIALGDAVAVFHPGYGAGMEVAAKEALALADCLQEQDTAFPTGELSGFARRFQQRIASIIATQWAIETTRGNA